MKQFKIISLAVLFMFVMTGLAFATGIPQVVDPKNVPIVWTESVYNGSGSEIDSATVVLWDFDASDPSGTVFDDMTNYIKASDGADNIWTAGVTLVEEVIANGNVGQIIIRGPALVDRGGDSITVNQLVGSDDDGSCVDFGGAADQCVLGRSIKSTASVNGFPDLAVIFIDVSCSD